MNWELYWSFSPDLPPPSQPPTPDPLASGHPRASWVLRGSPCYRRADWTVPTRGASPKSWTSFEATAEGHHLPIPLAQLRPAALLAWVFLRISLSGLIGLGQSSSSLTPSSHVTGEGASQAFISSSHLREVCVALPPRWPVYGQ